MLLAQRLLSKDFRFNLVPQRHVLRLLSLSLFSTANDTDPSRLHRLYRLGCV